MIEALIDRERRGPVLAQLAKGRMRAKTADLSMALEGRFDDHHVLMCRLHLDHIDHLEAMIARLDAQIEAMMILFQAARNLLATAPGIGQLAAAVIWRDMKSVLDLRPVYHRLEERIRAHVLLCWLALLLVRVAENTTGKTWPQMRRELERIHLGTFTGPAGTFRQRTELSKPARDLLAALSVEAPRKIHELTAGT